jgi:hypothetical protein
MAITTIAGTNTFRDWLNKTNEIIAALNSAALVNGVVANGAFTVNGSLLVQNTFVANSTLVWMEGNTKFSANVTATSDCNVWNFACGTLLIQPLNGTIVNTDISINGAATFLQVTNFSANVFIVADESELTGNLLLTGAFSANGPLFAQHISYAATGALVVPAHLTNPQYDDYQPAGGDAAEVWNLTPDINTALTGLAAPTEFVTGTRILYIQNLSAVYTISLPSANTSSQTNNRFKSPSNITATIPPGGAVGVVWSSTNKEWRVLAPSATTLPSLSVTGLSSFTGNATFLGYVNVATTLQVTGNSQLGNTNVSGWLNVSSTLTIAGLSTLTGNATLSGYANIAGTLGVGGNATLSGFANIAGTLAVGGISQLTGNVTFSGFANIAQTLNVAGISQLTGNTTLAGFANVAGTLQVTGNSQLAHVGFGIAAHINAVAQFAGQYFSPLVNMANTGTAMTVNWNSGNEQYANVNAAVTITMSNGLDGARYVLILKTGTSLGATWDAAVSWGLAGAPTLSTAAGKYDIFTFTYLAGINKYLGAYSQGY